MHIIFLGGGKPPKGGPFMSFSECNLLTIEKEGNCSFVPIRHVFFARFWGFCEMSVHLQAFDQTRSCMLEKSAAMS